MANHIPKIVEAEEHNLSAALEVLGTTAELLDDFDSVYEGLPPIVALPGDGEVSDEALAVFAARLLSAFCRRQLTMGVLTLFRAYAADSVLHLRRAIESCAFAVRLVKHPELASVWLNASENDTTYGLYRKSFKPPDVFPDVNHSDHSTVIGELKDRYDRCSKSMHGSIFGIAGHFSFPDDGATRSELKFFDLPPGHTLITILYFTLDSHRRILHLLGELLRPHMSNGFSAWNVRLSSVEAKLDFHREKWKQFVPDPRRT